MTLEFHPLAKAFPLASPKDLNDLQNDIREHGQLEPIWLYEGKILDGRNRYIACDVLKVVPLVDEYEGDDPKGFVLSKNLHRRHLTPEEKRAVIAYFLKEEPDLSDRAIAEKAKASHPTVARVREDLFVPEPAAEVMEKDSIPEPPAPRREASGRKARGRPPKTAEQKEAQKKIAAKEREIEDRREAARVARETGEPLKLPPAPPKPPTDEERLQGWLALMQELMRYSPNKVISGFVEGLNDWDEAIAQSMHVQRRHAASQLFANRMGVPFGKAAA